METRTTSQFTWEAYEHVHTEKGADWFWALGIVAVSGAIVATLFNNVLFALLIVIGAFTMGLLAKKPAALVRFSIAERGIVVGNKLYPYQMLKSFWIEDSPIHGATLIIDARRILTPHIIIPIPDTVTPESVRDYLLDYLEEEELYEPTSHRILEMFGF